MGIGSWLLLGLVAGALAKYFTPGKDPSGWVVTIVLGICGAFVGGFIGSQLGFGTVDKFDLRGLVIAIIGTIVLLLGYRLFQKR